MKQEHKLALEILRIDMRITEARLSDAINHERELRILHGHAYDLMIELKRLRTDLILRTESIAKDP